jgi:hypothetical protein
MRNGAGYCRPPGFDLMSFRNHATVSNEFFRISIAVRWLYDVVASTKSAAVNGNITLSTRRPLLHVKDHVDERRMARNISQLHREKT